MHLHTKHQTKRNAKLCNFSLYRSCQSSGTLQGAILTQMCHSRIEDTRLGPHLLWAGCTKPSTKLGLTSWDGFQQGYQWGCPSFSAGWGLLVLTWSTLKVGFDHENYSTRWHKLLQAFLPQARGNTRVQLQHLGSSWHASVWFLPQPHPFLSFILAMSRHGGGEWKKEERRHCGRIWRIFESCSFLSRSGFSMLHMVLTYGDRPGLAWIKWEKQLNKGSVGALIHSSGYASAPGSGSAAKSCLQLHLHDLGLSTAPAGSNTGTSWTRKHSDSKLPIDCTKRCPSHS